MVIWNFSLSMVCSILLEFGRQRGRDLPPQPSVQVDRGSCHEGAGKTGKGRKTAWRGMPPRRWRTCRRSSGGGGEHCLGGCAAEHIGSVEGRQGRRRMTLGIGRSRFGGQPTRGHLRVGCTSAGSPDRQRLPVATAATGSCVRCHRRKDLCHARGRRRRCCARVGAIRAVLDLHRRKPEGSGCCTSPARCSGIIGAARHQRPGCASHRIGGAWRFSGWVSRGGPRS